MQYQMSGASVPNLAPQPKLPRTAPEIVHGSPAPRKSRAGWGILLVVLIAGLGWWLWPRSAEQSTATTGSTPAAVRTAVVATGAVTKTLRLTGTTGAERFASLLVPQLRGSRSESLREGKTFDSPGAAYTVQSNANRSSGGGSTSVGDGSSVTSSAGNSSSGGSAAMRASTSRVSSGSSTARSSTSGSSGGGTSSGSSGLGSTAGSLVGSGGGGGGGGGGVSTANTGGGGRMGGGGGGGGASEYSLVLQDAAKPGSLVKKGDVVAEFDRQFMLNRLEDYRASVAQMDASFIKLKAELEVQKKSHTLTIQNAKADLDRARLDVKTIPVLGAINAERIRLAAEEAEARYKQYLSEVKFVDERAKSQLRTAEIELQQARHELKRAEANTDRMLLKAPLGGLVVMQTMIRGTDMAQIQVGDQLFAGMRFMQIVDPSSMVISASVNQVDAEALRIGAKAKVRFDAFPGLELPAHVHAIGAMTRPGGQRAAFVKEVPVELKLDQMDSRVIPDLSVSVDVELARDTQAAVVPLASVFQDASGKTPHVFVKAGAGWERRDVELGLANNLAVAVKSGVKQGEVVALDSPPVDVNNKGQS